MKRLKCLLGFHKWNYYNKTKRWCENCGRVEANKYDFLEPFWEEDFYQGKG